VMDAINVATDLTRMSFVVRFGVSIATCVLLRETRKFVKTLIERFSSIIDSILCVN